MLCWLSTVDLYQYRLHLPYRWSRTIRFQLKHLLIPDRPRNEIREDPRLQRQIPPLLVHRSTLRQAQNRNQSMQLLRLSQSGRKEIQLPNFDLAVGILHAFRVVIVDRE